MDNALEAKRKEKEDKEKNERRLEMMRKARHDVETDNQKEATAKLNTRAK